MTQGQRGHTAVTALCESNWLGEGGESPLSPEHSGQNLLSLDQHHWGCVV